MLILRLLLLLVALLLAMSFAMYLITRNRGYLEFAWQTARVTGLILAVFAALYVLERYILVGWRVLL